MSRRASLQSQSAATRHEDSMWRTLSRHSIESETAHEREIYDTEEQAAEPFALHASEWAMAEEVREKAAEDKRNGHKHRRLGVTWKHLTVKGVGTDSTVLENFRSQWNIPKQIQESRAPRRLKTILENTHGCVKPGEMLLVLGRPGAGCTTLLKLLANKRSSFAEISGDVHYGSMTPEQAKKYQGQIIINTEDEIFFPFLSVRQTMDLATRMKIPNLRTVKDRTAYQKEVRDYLLKSMAIEHTLNTKVGNEYIRGVSGGERKRLSIVEVMATRGSIFCWDNSTRGLDASTALEWAKAMRAITDVLGITTIATLYQAGNGIFNQFDKVLVLDEGKEVFYGPREQARPFMEELGFKCTDGANIGDFLTGVTVPTERVIKAGYESRFPHTASTLREAYDKSAIKKQMEEEYDYNLTEEAASDTEEFKAAVADEKDSSKSPYTVSFVRQVQTCIIRQYQLLWGNQATLVIKQLSVLVTALMSGSIFYDAPADSTGLFFKGGALFTSLLLFTLIAMSEMTDSFFGRPVLAKHKDFALFHPAAFCVAQVVADIPLALFSVTIFSLPMYWLVGLRADAGAFFTYFIILYASFLNTTALFRLIGAAFQTIDAAAKFGGFIVNAIITYIGYMIPKSEMKPWFVWIFWINPMSYGFEALMGNEFKDAIISCVGPNLIPSGPKYTDRTFAACAGLGGARKGATSLTGEEYLGSLSYSSTRIWRNFGIILVWWALYVGLTIFFTCRWQLHGVGGGFLLIPREMKKLSTPGQKTDTESQMEEVAETGPLSNVSEKTSFQGIGNGHGNSTGLVRNTSIFTWKSLSYTVHTPSGERRLLDNVQGWVKPGTLGALMGSSGAGKTTLMDVLALRKTQGNIQGTVLIDGRPLPVSFQRSAGYCEQLDVHEPLTTVREALEFSALLRQHQDVPQEEKLQYVDVVVDLLELHDLQHCIIGRPGAGLSVEQRKRVTIGVELVAKPSILIFLDEPTSGLDGQSAYNTLRFLKKLAAAGQAILCTIHQPSAQLFSQFDTLLLLASGGKTVYFGDVGDNAATVMEYFARNGMPCPEDANPAEHMIDVVSGSLSQGRDWNRVWLESSEYIKVSEELNRMVQEAASKPVAQAAFSDEREFATDLWTQIKVVTRRMNIALWRNTDYTNNKISLHFFSALFNAFSFYKVGNSVADLQLTLFAIFNFVFVAPGVIAQLQPLFIARRDIYDAREKKSRIYSWKAFVTGLIISEFPYLIVCAAAYFLPFYWTVGLPGDSNKAGATFFVMLLYEFIYTGMGQAIAAFAPNAVFAALANPWVIGSLSSTCGVLVPYLAITPFWRYWMYYLNPFTFVMGALLTFALFDKPVRCKEREFAIFDTPNGQTCRDFLADYMTGFGARMNLTNPDATSQCRVCRYTTGADYLQTINIKDYYYGWRDVGVCAIFVFSGYTLVYLLMKARTKASKRAGN